MNSQSPDNATSTLIGSYVLQSISCGTVAVIRAYRAVLSPVLFSLLGPACRFDPSCSAYADEAISRYGIGRGGLLALKRLLQCRPFGGWGPDPVPPYTAQPSLIGRLKHLCAKRNFVG